jgi:hypothetical protein
MSNIGTLALVAWVGEDELGSGITGIKAAFAPAGFIPLATTEADAHKLARGEFTNQLQAQSNTYGKPIYLCRFSFDRVLMTITPDSKV